MNSNNYHGGAERQEKEAALEQLKGELRELKFLHDKKYFLYKQKQRELAELQRKETNYQRLEMLERTNDPAAIRLISKYEEAKSKLKETDLEYHKAECEIKEAEDDIGRAREIIHEDRITDAKKQLKALEADGLESSQFAKNLESLIERGANLKREEYKRNERLREAELKVQNIKSAIEKANDDMSKIEREIDAKINGPSTSVATVGAVGRQLESTHFFL